MDQGIHELDLILGVEIENCLKKYLHMVQYLTELKGIMRSVFCISEIKNFSVQLSIILIALKTLFIISSEESGDITISK